MIIYLITNLVNGKQYVGQTTTSLSERWKGHISQAATRHRQTYLASAIRKYGPDSFMIKELAVAASLSELNELEIKFIREFQAYLPNVGYNLTFGGEGGFPTEETRKRISKATSASLIGKPQSDKQRKAISAAREGYKASLEHCAAIAAGHLGKTRKFCKRGHLFEEPNLQYSKDGKRRFCKQCIENRYADKKNGLLITRTNKSTHCVHGHEYAVTGFYTNKHGGRQCKVCTLMNNRKQHTGEILATL